MNKLASLCLIPLLGLGACAGMPGSYTNPNGQSVSCGTGTNTIVGAAAGALGGGLLGNMAGKRSGRNTRTLGGAAAGGLIGGLLGGATEQPCYNAGPQPYANYGVQQQPQGYYGQQGYYGSPAQPPRYYGQPQGGYYGQQPSGYAAPGYYPSQRGYYGN